MGKDRKLSVCMLTSSFPRYRGHHRAPFIFELARSIVAKGVNVEILAPHHQDSRKFECWDGVKIHRFQYMIPVEGQILSSGEGMPPNLRRYWIARLQVLIFGVIFFLKSLAHVRKAHVIHANWMLVGLIAIMVKKLLKRPIILTIRGADMELARKYHLLKRLTCFVIENVSFVTTVNQTFKKVLIQFGIPPEKIKVTRSGIDIVKFRPIDQQKAKMHCKLPLDRKIVLFVGSLIERKGVSYLIDAIPEIIANRDDVLFVIVGDGEQCNKLIRKAKRNGVADYVRFVGAKKFYEMPLWYNAGDLFVLPSLSEGTANVCYEALSCGIPVIATDVGGTSELIRSGENGILIESGNHSAISKSVLLLLEDEKMRRQLKEKSKKRRTDQGRHWDEAASDFIGLYQRSLLKEEE